MDFPLVNMQSPTLPALSIARYAEVRNKYPGRARCQDFIDLYSLTRYSVIKHGPLNITLPLSIPVKRILSLLDIYNDY